MGLHIQVTFVLFFVNVLLTLFFPQYTFLSENIYSSGQYGDYNYNNDVNQYVGGSLDEDSQNSVNSFGLFDVFSLIVDFIKFIMNFFVGLPVLIMLLPITGVMKIIFFFPVMLLYAFAIVGWIRTGN